MKKLCLLLCFVMVLTCVYPGMFASATTASLPELYETYVFDFSNGAMSSIVANQTPCIDAKGNTFYPLHSASDEASASLEQITVNTSNGTEVVDTLKLSAPAHTTFVPVDANGKPYEIQPGATYEVALSVYVKCSGTYSQLFFGGGVFGAYKPEYTTSSIRFPGTKSDAFSDMEVKFPIYRSGSIAYQDWGGNYYATANKGKTVRYYETYTKSSRQYYTDTVTFTTGDYIQRKKGFELTATNGVRADFGNYFAVMTDGGMVNAYDADGNLVANAPVQFNIASISITKIAQKEIKESNTVIFDFDEGSVPAVAVNETVLLDSKGHSFYPLHSLSDDVEVKQENIAVSTADTKETVGTLKISAPNRTMVIPLDEDGMPYEMTPNSEYEVKVSVYVKCSGTYSQLFFGGGIYGAYEKAYFTPSIAFEGSDQNLQKKMQPKYPIFRTQSVAYQDWGGNYYGSQTLSSKVRYYEGYSDKNRYQYYNETISFTTGDYTEGDKGFSLIGEDGESAVFGPYFGFMTDGGMVNVYDAQGQKVTTAPVQYNIDRIELTKVVQNAPVTLNANGGAFETGNTLATKLAVGGPLSVDTVPIYEGHLLVGWSLTPNGEPLVGRVDASLNGKTLYAVWEENVYEGYDRYERTVDFSKWKVRVNQNCWAYSHDGITDAPYFSIKRDASVLGGSYLHCHYGASQGGAWLGNFNLTVTPTGSCNASGEGDENIALPTGTTYRVTAGVRVNYTNKPLTYYVVYGDDFSSASDHYTVMQENIQQTDGFVDVVGYFTTPEEYTVKGSATLDQFYIGLTTGGNVDADFDIDYVKLEKMAKSYVYTVKADGQKLLMEETVHRPGDFVELPQEINEELYHDYDAKAQVTKASVTGWYLDETCTTAVCEKRVGNTDTTFYGKLANEQTVSTQNQAGYCGFDLYTCEYDEGVLYFDRASGMGCTITDEQSATGKASLKVTAKADTKSYLSSFEIRNRNTFSLCDKTTYRIDFSYKSDADFTLGFGVGKANNAAKKNVLFAEQSFEASEAFRRGSVMMETDFSAANAFAGAGLVPVGQIMADGNVTVYLDDMTVSKVVSTVGVSRLIEPDKNGKQALRFYMAYESGAVDSVPIAGNNLTIVKRGILFKSGASSEELLLENAGKHGIIKSERIEDFQSCWSQNPITTARVFSVCVTGLEQNDTREISARGYVVTEDGQVYYGKPLTTCVAAIPNTPDLLDYSRLDATDGLLTHSSLTESAIDTANGGQSMKDAYFFLPTGTVINSTTPYKVFFYNEFFELNTALMSDFGITLEDAFNPTSITGSLVMRSGSYVRLASEDRLDTVTIDVPTEQYQSLYSGSRVDLMYDVEIGNVERKIAQTAEGCVNYLFITDIHYCSSDSSEIKNALVRQMNTIAKMANEDESIDFVAVGGDITTGMYSSRESAISDTNRILEPLKQSTKPVLILVGNHDDNCYHCYWSGGIDYRPALVVGQKEWTQGVLQLNSPDTIVHDSHNPHSRYYYYDLVGKKTRIICLDAIDYPYETDEEGNLVAMKVKNDQASGPSRCYSGATYWGYSHRQMTWLIQEALKAPDGYDYIFLSHMGIDYDTNCYGSAINCGTELRQIIGAYQMKQPYMNSKIGTVDFSDATGRILVYQFGHMHTELVLYSDDIDVWQVSTATPSIDQYSKTLSVSENINNKKLDWRYYKRRYNTITEASFDAMTVGHGVIHKYAFGVGSDRKMYND